MLLHAHDQLGAAAVCYRRAQALDPKAFSWPYYLSAVESGLGNHAEALRALDEALRIDPSYAAARQRRAEILLDQGRLEQSASLFAEITAAEPKSASAWYGLGRAQSGLGQTEEAVKSFTKAVGNFPQFGSAHYALAQALRNLNRSEDASRHLASYERFKLFIPPSEDRLMAELAARTISVTNYLRQAADLQSQGRTKEALDLHLKALETDANSAQAHANLVSLYAQLNEPSQAEQHYRKAVELSPNLADAHYNYGVLLYREQKYGEARRTFELALKANRYHAEAHNNLGYLLEREGRPSEAEKHYREAIANLPGYRLAHFHLGRLLLNRRDFAGAVAQLEQTVTVDDDSTPGYLYALGAAHGRAGDPRRAVEFLRQAREKAAARGQLALLSSIERDLAVLERRKPAP